MLKVFTAGNLVGEIFQSSSDNRDFIFNYERNCPPDNAVSLSMGVIADPYIFKGSLHPVFDMNLPEGALLDKLKRLFQKQIANFSDLDLLSIVGQNQIGRLTFGNKVSQLEVGLNIQEFKTYKGTEDLLQELIHKYARVSGISGVQPKVLVQDTSRVNSEDQLKISQLDKLTHKEATHIIKSWSEHSDYPELATNEYFCMLAAKYSGLKVPNFELTNNGKFLIVERFDFNFSNNSYLGFEDFCVLTAKISSQKYDGTYERIANKISENLVGVSEKNAKPALLEYFKSVVLSIALGNGDAHLKNFGLIYPTPESEINLAPAFDIVTTRVYFNDIMALTLDGRKSWPKLKVINRFGLNNCKLTKPQVNKAILEVKHGIALAKKQLLAHSSVTPNFEKLGQSMAKIWDIGVQQSLS